MSTLIPILTKQENDPAFLEQALRKEKEVYLMAIVENEALELDFGFTAKEISIANDLIAKIKETLTAQKKHATEILEWGETVHKIVNFYKLKKIKKICLKKQDSASFKKLVKQLKENRLNVEVI